MKTHHLRAFYHNDAGNVAMTAALCALPLFAAVTAGLDFQDVVSAKSKLQEAVDAGALAGARQLTVAGTSSNDTAITATATNVATTTIAGGISASPVTFTVTTDHAANSVTVVGQTEHQPLIGFLSFAQKTISATATADGLRAAAPLCILQTGPGALKLNDTSHIRATGCGIHANDDINVAGTAAIQAQQVQAVGTVTGPVQPTGQSGAAHIDDPFANLDLTPPSTCASSGKQVIAGQSVVQLAPGVHCDSYKVAGKATLQLLPGDHYFMQPLEIKQNASLSGDDVVLIFSLDKAASFGDSGSVSISARRSGKFSGFLIVTTRDNNAQFSIASGNVSKLLGTIYIPDAELNVSTTGNVAQDSAWSVIVAKTLTLTQNPNLVINNNYVGSGVPVPEGVGPNTSTVVHLTK